LPWPTLKKQLNTLHSQQNNAKSSVVIIGGGPVGLSLASLLAAKGVYSVVVEADASYCTGSRAICLSRRSLEIMGWMGAESAIAAKALPWTDGRSFYQETEVLNFTMPHDPGQRFFPMVNLQQYYVEQFALEAGLSHKDAKGQSYIDIRWGTRLSDIQRDAKNTTSTVTLSTVNSSDGSQETLNCQYLIACDGGRSFVREQLGLSLKGIQYEGRYVIVDVVQKTKRPTERLAWFDPPSNPGSTILMHRQPDDVWRIDYQLDDHEDSDEAIKPENVLPRIKSHLEWIGETEPWEPLWISIYNAKCLTLDQYRHGPIFFAGDAAHMVPIFGVRGLNSGIDDVGNLAWKLASVIRGEAPSCLLDSYNTERRGAALVNIDYGSKSTEFMAPPSLGFKLLREATLRLAQTTPEVRPLINPRQSLPVAYSDHSLLGPDWGYDNSTTTPIFGLGLPAPDARFEKSPTVFQHLSQSFGHGFVLLHLFPTEATLHFEGLSIITITKPMDCYAEVATRYGAHENSLVLIRPDGYVAARWCGDRVIAQNKAQINDVLVFQFHLIQSREV
jgi:3-(3-hydroxy-phenyl)propionate hydroxylase